jgi:hypothetical protein
MFFTHGMASEATVMLVPTQRNTMAIIEEKYSVIVDESGEEVKQTSVRPYRA